MCNRLKSLVAMIVLVLLVFSFPGHGGADRYNVQASRAEWTPDTTQRADDYSMASADGVATFQVSNPGRLMTWSCTLPETIDTGKRKFLTLVID